MFIFVQYFKSNNTPKYTHNGCSDDVRLAQEYATTLLGSSVDVESVEVYNRMGGMQKVEKMEWVG